jgi:subtilisin family serine protease
LNAIVIEGVTQPKLLTIPYVIEVTRDSQKELQTMHKASFTNLWGLDSVDLPVNNDYSPNYRGCGVNIYVVDTGLDTLHAEFAAVPGTARIVANIFNINGSVSTNTDTYGHGTHVAG